VSKLFATAALASGLALAAHTASAAVVTLTFEGVGNNNSIGNFYNGGAGGNDGISFGSGALGLVSAQDGGSGNFTNAPSGDTIAYFLSGPGDVMNVAAGFNTGFSFYYADQVGFTGLVQVFSGVNGTGTLLASLNLPATPNPYNVFVPVGVAFAGIAESVIFGGSANYIGFDNITLGASMPNPVPEPVSLGLFGAGIACLAFGARKRGSVAQPTSAA
jgi:hypothetical protein